jgi:peptide-methionine (R)-S-oxide reductase
MRQERRRFLTTGFGLVLLPLVGAGSAEAAPFRLSDAAWRRRLSPAAYKVLRQGGTERPFSSPLDKERRPGIYRCAGCQQPLFSSAAKFDSGTGWPSFHSALPGAVSQRREKLAFWRVEVRCSRCLGHLGHVFDDGPPPTGKRFCMNGVALSFQPRGRASG